MKQAYWHPPIIPGLQRAIRESTSSRLGLRREVVFQEREIGERERVGQNEEQANSSVGVRYRLSLTLSRGIH